MSATLMFWLGLAALLATFLTLVRVRQPIVLCFPIMMTGWLVGEYALFHLVLQIATAIALVATGALDTTRGLIGLAMFALSALGLVVCRIRVARARPTAEAALETTLGADHLAASDLPG